jgi:hypothetical protein
VTLIFPRTFEPIALISCGFSGIFRIQSPFSHERAHTTDVSDPSHTEPHWPEVTCLLLLRSRFAASRIAPFVPHSVVLTGPPLAIDAPARRVPGVAEPNATEMRITQLGGRVVLPRIPARPVIASGLIAILIALCALHLAASAHQVAMICRYCD